MKKTYVHRIWLCCIIIIILAMNPNTPAYATDGVSQDTIKVVMDDDYPPYSYKDSNGKLQGILVDQWMLWQKKTGIQVELYGMDWESALRKMKKGEFDVIDTIFYNEERTKYFAFTKQYTKIEVSLFFQKNISGIVDTESLKGFNVGVKAGDNSVDFLVDKGVDTLIEYTNYRDIIEAAKAQKITTFVMDRPSAMFFLYKNDMQDRFKEAPSLYYGELHRAVLKENHELLNTIDSGFLSISKNEYNAIDKKWFGKTPVSSGVVFKFLTLFSVVAVVLLLLLVWNMLLKRAVKMKTGELSETLEKYKESEKNIYRMSIIDIPTGMYNRNFFESELNRIQNEDNTDVGIVVCDIDGLKLINDMLGHSAGDDYLKESAMILRQSFSEEDIIARIGGDEFAVIIKNATKKDISSKMQRITEKLEKTNQDERVVPISMSCGYAMGHSRQTDLKEIFRAADNMMYHEKLHHKQSEKSKNLNILTKMLEERDFITEGHGERMKELCCELAGKIGISEAESKDMRLFAHFHDIGKIGIPDRILFKPDILTAEEMNVMKGHTEIGYRITVASADLIHISDWILKHHEWWNGNGYPLNLKGEDIPIQCRILAIVDVFDAMTSDRPYRKALSREAAIAEILKNKGIQFDPKLVDEFIAMMDAKS